MRSKLQARAAYHPGILIDRIPVSGIPGLLFTIAIWWMVLGAIPAARTFLFITGGAGVIGAALLYYWHNQTDW